MNWPAVRELGVEVYGGSGLRWKAAVPAADELPVCRDSVILDSRFVGMMSAADKEGTMEEPLNGEYTLHVVARLRGDFPSKFGIPRQSGLVEGLESRVVFEDGFRDENALRGLKQFSHLWLIWLFSENLDAGWSPTVRPPKLGGNERLGVFATRSPFRPNPIGLSCVRLLAVERDATYGSVLRVAGADMMDGTPIIDIKPYIPYADSHPEAAAGFTARTLGQQLRVVFPPNLLERVPEDRRVGLTAALSQDPRPGYQHDPDRVYGFSFAGLDVRFQVEGDLLTVVGVQSVDAESGK